MSYTGRQLNIASKRRQGGKVETHSDLLMGREPAEVGELVIAVVGGERNQQQQAAGQIVDQPWRSSSRGCGAKSSSAEGFELSSP
ncbi:MAG: hypothetical protein ACKO45_12145 [Cyanobium sp.]